VLDALQHPMPAIFLALAARRREKNPKRFHPTWKRSGARSLRTRVHSPTKGMLPARPAAVDCPVSATGLRHCGDPASPHVRRHALHLRVKS
jgi:hypothetical protein